MTAFSPAPESVPGEIVAALKLVTPAEEAAIRRAGAGGWFNRVRER